MADEHGLTDGMSSRWQARWPWFYYSGDTVDYRGREPGGQESGLTTAVIRAGEAGVTLKGKGKSSDLSGETNDSSWESIGCRNQGREEKEANLGVSSVCGSTVIGEWLRVPSDITNSII